MTQMSHQQWQWELFWIFLYRCLVDGCQLALAEVGALLSGSSYFCKLIQNSLLTREHGRAQNFYRWQSYSHQHCRRCGHHSHITTYLYVDSVVKPEVACYRQLSLSRQIVWMPIGHLSILSIYTAVISGILFMGWKTKVATFRRGYALDFYMQWYI